MFVEILPKLGVKCLGYSIEKWGHGGWGVKCVLSGLGGVG